MALILLSRRRHRQRTTASSVSHAAAAAAAALAQRPGGLSVVTRAVSETWHGWVESRSTSAVTLRSCDGAAPSGPGGPSANTQHAHTCAHTHCLIGTSSSSSMCSPSPSAWRASRHAACIVQSREGYRTARGAVPGGATLAPWLARRYRVAFAAFLPTGSERRSAGFVPSCH